jgi:hypothetical protein
MAARLGEQLHNGRLYSYLVGHCGRHDSGQPHFGPQAIALRGFQSGQENWRFDTNTLKLIGVAIIQLGKEAWLLPQTISIALEQRRRQVVLNENEFERLDRLRNPSKYQGK